MAMENGPFIVDFPNKTSIQLGDFPAMGVSFLADKLPLPPAACQWTPTTTNLCHGHGDRWRPGTCETWQGHPVTRFVYFLPQQKLYLGTKSESIYVNNVILFRALLEVKTHYTETKCEEVLKHHYSWIIPRTNLSQPLTIASQSHQVVQYTWPG